MILKEPGKQYISIVRNKLQRLGTDLMEEDLDILCQYIVMRFLKTSPFISDASSVEDVAKQLDQFVEGTYSFIVTFIHVMNSSVLIPTVEA